MSDWSQSLHTLVTFLKRQRDVLRSFMARREQTSKKYEEQLRTLKEKLLLIVHKAEEAIADATRALIERRPALAQLVIDRDDEINALEIEIDNICFGILACEQPVASDLRFITTAMKIVADSERIADNGVNIARRALEIVTEPELKPVIDIPVGVSAAQRIVREQMLRELLTYMFEDPHAITRALRLILVSRQLERVGDIYCYLPLLRREPHTLELQNARRRCG